MRITLSLALMVMLALAACRMTTPEKPALLDDTVGAVLLVWPDLLERVRPVENISIAYGPDPLQVADLWLPKDKELHPVVLMIHGGCWQTNIADRRIMNWIADDLRARGIAVWNIDYRGVDRAGGGYPVTFLDAAQAADALREHAVQYHLDLSRLVAVGHSAGGHLALWLAGRGRLPRESALRIDNPLPIKTVISLGGLPDLEEAARPPGSGCGTEVIAKLIGNGRPDPYADTSVPRLAPLGVQQILINGVEDKIIPAFYAESYAASMRAAGDEVKVRMINHTGHVELIAPESAAWATAIEEIGKALR